MGAGGCTSTKPILLVISYLMFSDLTVQAYALGNLSCIMYCRIELCMMYNVL